MRRRLVMAAVNLTATLVGATGAYAASGLTPLVEADLLTCQDFCTDTYELKCPTGALTMDVALEDFVGFLDNERFIVILTGLAPSSLYGKSDSDWAQGTADAFVSLSRPTAGSIKAVMSVISVAPSTFNRDYNFTFRCRGVGGVFKNGSWIRKQNQ